MFQILLYFLCKNCNLPSEKSHPPLPQKPSSKSWGPVKPPPLFSKIWLETQPPCRKGVGCTLWLFGIMRHNTSTPFLAETLYTFRVENWWNLTWAVESLKFCTVVGSFCKSQIKFQLKKYRRLISYSIEEWCKV